MKKTISPAHLLPPPTCLLPPAVKLLPRGAVVLCCIILSACSIFALDFEKRDLTITCTDGTTVPIKVELARSVRELTKGYMGRKNIPEGTGMLFIFKKDEKLSFWMKNTPTALSIAFISSTGEIREIRDMTPFSLASVESSYSVRYALEVPQGWFAKKNIKPGSTIQLP